MADDGSQSNLDPAAAASRMTALLTTFRQVGLPLLQALNAPHDGEGGHVAHLNGEVFGTLVDSTVTLSQKLAAEFGAEDNAFDAWVRWAIAGAASQVVATNFQATGQVLSEEEAKSLATMVISLQDRFTTQIPADSEPVPNTLATFRAKMTEAMVPVIGAIARFAFGRAEHALLADVAERMVRTADQVTRALAPPTGTPEEWRFLCWSILRAAGQIYADSHYAEADRLLYMNPDDRAAYYAQNGQIPPMTQVWQSFNQRMAMLATLATYLEVPASAQMDSGAWQ